MLQVGVQTHQQSALMSMDKCASSMRSNAFEYRQINEVETLTYPYIFFTQKDFLDSQTLTYAQGFGHKKILDLCEAKRQLDSLVVNDLAENR